jgi:hypothetical protein
VSSRDGQIESVTTASQGRVEIVGSDRFLFLENGQQWLTHLDTGETRLTQFERYQLLIDTDTAPVGSVRNSRQSTTLQLIQQPSPNTQAELAWRVGLVFTAINMVLLALALSLFYQVFGRYVIGKAPGWTEEVARMLVAGMAMLGAAACLRDGGHIAVGALVNAVPPSVRSWLLAVRDLCIMTTAAVLGWSGARFADMNATQDSPALEISMAIP